MSAVVGGIILVVLAGLLKAWIQWQIEHEGAAGAHGATTLRLPTGYAAVGAVLCAFSLACAVGTIVATTDARPRWIGPEDRASAVVLVAGFLSFVGLGALLIVAWRIQRVAIDADGARGVDCLFHRFAFRWTDVERVRSNASLRWWLLDVPGRVVRVSFDAIGASVFASHVLQHVPAHVTAPERANLEAAVWS